MNPHPMVMSNKKPLIEVYAHTVDGQNPAPPKTAWLKLSFVSICRGIVSFRWVSERWCERNVAAIHGITPTCGSLEAGRFHPASPRSGLSHLWSIPRNPHANPTDSRAPSQTVLLLVSFIFVFVGDPATNQCREDSL